MTGGSRKQPSPLSPFPDPSLNTQRNVGARGTRPAVRPRLGTLSLGEGKGSGAAAKPRPPWHPPTPTPAPCTGCPLFSRSSLKRNFRSRSWMTASFEPWISSSEAILAVLLAFLGNPLWASTQRGQGQGHGQGQARTPRPSTTHPEGHACPAGCGTSDADGNRSPEKVCTPRVHPPGGEMRARAGEAATNTGRCLYPDLGFHRVRCVTLGKLPNTCHKQV